jgi:hypothetical protein
MEIDFALALVLEVADVQRQLDILPESSPRQNREQYSRGGFCSMLAKNMLATK